MDNGCSLQAEKEVTELTNELQKVEDELDAAESRLADITLQLEEAEIQADENERYCTVLCGLEQLLYSNKCHKLLQQPPFKKPARLISTNDV